ncbi:MAG: DNA-binding protein [Flavobacterium sp.]|nr:MAG: DNA-binding protein [Flavobacterium sp.]
MEVTMLTGLNANELLERIGQLIDAKLGVQVQTTEKQSNYLTRQETASLLKITLQTLHTWTKEGYLKAYRMGSRVLYKEVEVIAMLEQVPTFKHKKGGYHA